MVGDSLYTDIQFAIDSDVTSILVLTGEDALDDLDQSVQNPDSVFDLIKDFRTMLN